MNNDFVKYWPEAVFFDLGLFFLLVWELHYDVRIRARALHPSIGDGNIVHMHYPNSDFAFVGRRQNNLFKCLSERREVGVRCFALGHESGLNVNFTKVFELLKIGIGVLKLEVLVDFEFSLRKQEGFNVHFNES